MWLVLAFVALGAGLVYAFELLSELVRWIVAVLAAGVRWVWARRRGAGRVSP